MEHRLPRKLATILYSDVAGCTRLSSEDEEGTHRRLNVYPDLLSNVVEEHQGRVVHYAGDAVRLAYLRRGNTSRQACSSIPRATAAGLGP